MYIAHIRNFQNHTGHLLFHWPQEGNSLLICLGSPCALKECRTSHRRTGRKIKVASTMTNLAKSLQSCKVSKEYIGKQDTIPSGWLPDSIIEEEKEKETERSKLLVTPDVFTVNDIGILKKNITPKHSEGNHDLASSIKEKIHAHQTAPGEPRNFMGNDSLNGKHHHGEKTLGQKEEQKMGLCSSSLDTEDSGLGEDADNSDQTEVEKIKPINRPKIKVSTIGDLRNQWQKFAEEHVEGQKLNPFSEDFDYNHAMAVRLLKGELGYGHPKEGSKTAQRAERAKKHIHREMDEMCFIIHDMGQMDKEGHIYVTFGRLFDHYVKISDKVVGILLRCRKHKMVDFEGEMLWQGQDDDVQIRLLV
ncbi:actin-binding Rho-activating protein isoform X1 [Pangasianodon hypophthalmus]|uniref:actin-binding Rho-activating protein isoform X1 n=1 Tax=Pangasianodon hypophthalmus TaxID=310915 RepID=UPI002307816F|nr:actin-binding Rho-activating protein isoform X1 [Pangasianodon hypophthalmus]XP_026779400.2 actin-binding Rho-activating protein isoform X1 [Pangasianodon hypophthalmus]XP_053088192.1 actin-binding Rho-activating protein isoform X1 [Pangasianodon hypophthalmus]XP_053088193.1 actin-binding Rho-activating protein isoform X1 [Pangasianodon hypophthalmus]